MALLDDHQAPTEPIPEEHPTPDKDPPPDEDPVPDHNPVAGTPEKND